MNIFENFSTLFVEVWKKGILGIDIFPVIHIASQEKIFVSLDDIKEEE